MGVKDIDKIGLNQLMESFQEGLYLRLNLFCHFEITHLLYVAQLLFLSNSNIPPILYQISLFHLSKIFELVAPIQIENIFYIVLYYPFQVLIVLIILIFHVVIGNRLT
jgi:hypothetical protein